MIRAALLLGGLLALLAIPLVAIARNDAAARSEATRHPGPDRVRESFQFHLLDGGGSFLDWNLAGSWTIALAPTVTANREAASIWTVPVGLGVSSITRIGPLPVSVGLTYLGHVIRPPGTGSSQARFVSSFPFPKAPVK